MNVTPAHRTKVMRIITRLNVGGPSVHVVDLVAGMDPNRFHQVLVSGKENPSEGSMLDYALSRNVRPQVVPEMASSASFTYRDARALVKLYRAMRRQRPHIVHTHTAKAGFLGRVAARLARVPIVVHTYHGHVLHGYYGRLTTSVLRTMERALGRVTDRVIAVSQQTQRELLAYGVASGPKITVIPLGLNLDPYLGCAPLRDEFRSEVGMADGAPLVGIVGRLFQIKNHRLFLQAAARVAVQQPEARFAVVGDGILRSEMERHTQELGIAERVVFTGWRRDLDRIYAGLDVLVVSSDNEGTPASTIEAMASGCPVVATRVGGMPELIVEGENGYLVPPRDPELMASALLRIIDDPATAFRMGQEARDMAVSRYSVERLVADTEALYQELLQAKGLGP